jgi:hypothetical protein
VQCSSKQRSEVNSRKEDNAPADGAEEKRKELNVRSHCRLLLLLQPSLLPLAKRAKKEKKVVLLDWPQGQSRRSVGRSVCWSGDHAKLIYCATGIPSTLKPEIRNGRSLGRQQNTCFRVMFHIRAFNDPTQSSSRPLIITRWPIDF